MTQLMPRHWWIWYSAMMLILIANAIWVTVKAI